MRGMHHHHVKCLIILDNLWTVLHNLLEGPAEFPYMLYLSQ